MEHPSQVAVPVRILTVQYIQTGATKNHINGSDSLGGGHGHPRNDLVNRHISMLYYPSSVNRV